MRTEHRPAPGRSRRRSSNARSFFMGFGVRAFGVLLAKYAVIPLLVWVQTLVGGAP